MNKIFKKEVYSTESEHLSNKPSNFPGPWGTFVRELTCSLGLAYALIFISFFFGLLIVADDIVIVSSTYPFISALSIK